MNAGVGIAVGCAGAALVVLTVTSLASDQATATATPNRDPRAGVVGVAPGVSKVCDGPTLVYVGRDGKGGIGVALDTDSPQCVR